MSKKDEENKNLLKSVRNDLDDVKIPTTAIAGMETVARYGSANAEYIIGYQGKDNITGQEFQKSLKKISTHKVHPDFHENNLRQQAGFSAEVHKVSRDNAENIIAGKARRTIRTDDLPEYGVNHPMYDHVELENGKIIAGSGSQMKFSKDCKNVLRKIAEGEGKGKNDWSRYLGEKLDLPSEQAEEARQFCHNQAEELRKQAAHCERQGKADLANQKRQRADNYDQLKKDIRDSGISSKEARFLREHPKLATTLDIAKTSHRAGCEAARYGAAIGGGIAVIQNIFALSQGDKEFADAILDTGLSTAKTATAGYATGFVGSALKGVMRQSEKATIRTLSQTSLPALAVSVCLETSSTITRFVRGEIDGLQMMEELGEKGTGMLASGLGATLGQIALPVPVLGALMGGMIGYTMSSIFYQSTLQAWKNARRARENYLHIKAQCEEARAQMEFFQQRLQELFDQHMLQTRDQIDSCLAGMDSAADTGDMDDFLRAARNLGQIVGKELPLATRQEFEDFMASDEALIL